MAPAWFDSRRLHFSCLSNATFLAIVTRHFSKFDSIAGRSLRLLGHDRASASSFQGGVLGTWRSTSFDQVMRRTGGASAATPFGPTASSMPAIGAIARTPQR